HRQQFKDAQLGPGDLGVLHERSVRDAPVRGPDRARQLPVRGQVGGGDRPGGKSARRRVQWELAIRKRSPRWQFHRENHGSKTSSLASPPLSVYWLSRSCQERMSVARAGAPPRRFIKRPPPP